MALDSRVPHGQRPGRPWQEGAAWVALAAGRTLELAGGGSCGTGQRDCSHTTGAPCSRFLSWCKPTTALNAFASLIIVPFGTFLFPFVFFKLNSCSIRRFKKKVASTYYGHINYNFSLLVFLNRTYFSGVFPLSLF